MSSSPLPRRGVRALSAALGLGLAATGTGTAILTTPSAHAADPVTITLLNLNDFHGRIQNDATGSGDPRTISTVEMASVIEQIRQTKGEEKVALLSAGDNIGASLFASSNQQDSPTIDVLNALGLAASAVGNHEFDRGFADLDTRVDAEADFPYLGANVYQKGTMQPALDEYALVEVAGYTLGVIGTVTEETPTLVSPGGIETLDFGDPVEATNRVAAQLSDGDAANGEADLIVAEYHEGAKLAGQTIEQEASAGGVFDRIVNDTDATVDVIFTGHTHKTYAWEAPKPGGGTRPVVQTGSYGANIGQVDIALDANGAITGFTVANVPVGTSEVDLPRVRAVDEIVRAAVAAADVIGDVPVGTVTDSITTAFSGGTYTADGYTQSDLTKRDVRSSESTLGNLVADALRDTPIDVPGLPVPDVGIVNPGGLRNELFYEPNLGGSQSPRDADGVVTFEEANAVLPFVNNIFYVDLTGAELEQVLEQQWRVDGQGNVSKLHLGVSDNVRVTVDPSAPAGDRITSVRVDGAPIDPAATYTVSTFSFLATGGDGFSAFVAGDSVDTGKVDRDLWIDGYLGNGQSKSPDYSRRQVIASGVPATVTADQAVSADLPQLNLTSLGSPANTSVKAFAVLGDSYRVLGSFPVDAAGAASVDLTAPADLTGDWGLALVAEPSRTLIGADLPELASEVAASAKSYTYGRGGSVSVTVNAPLAATGPVEVYSGSKLIGEGVVENGSATIALPAKALLPGQRTLTVDYLGDDMVAGDTTTVKVTVGKQPARLDVDKAPGKLVAERTRPKLRIEVLTPTSKATGSVVVRAGGRTYRASLRSGVATVTLRPFSSAGTRSIRIGYAGDTLTQAIVRTIQVRVVRK